MVKHELYDIVNSLFVSVIIYISLERKIQNFYGEIKFLELKLTTFLKLTVGRYYLSTFHLLNLFKLI